METHYTQNKTGRKNLLVLLLFSLLPSITGCDSYLETGLTQSQLTSNAVYADYTTANAALSDAYSKLRDNSVLSGTLFGVSTQLGTYTDELDYYGAATNPALSFYTNSVLPSNTTITQFWNSSYTIIYSCNAVMEEVESATFSPQQIAQLKGESLFIRGLLHFYLSQLFGAIPYVQATDYRINSIVSKMPAADVYTNVVKDLKTSSNLLGTTYLSSERGRPNSFTAKSLLARIYLYMGDWENASKMASEVIETTSLYNFENNPDAVFLKNSPETIWQFIPAFEGKNTDEATLFIFTSGPPPQVALSQSLLNFFTADDLRKSHWTGTVSNENGTWHYPNKYKEAQAAGSSKEYSIVLRLTEQYLIRAEARAQLGDLDGAKEDLNKSRNRAGLPKILSNSKESLLEEIIAERRKEFFTEHGHRFFDLKRSGKIDAALTTKPGWNSTHALLPLPENELGLNPNLKPQNPGY